MKKYIFIVLNIMMLVPLSMFGGEKLELVEVVQQGTENALYLQSPDKSIVIQTTHAQISFIKKNPEGIALDIEKGGSMLVHYDLDSQRFVGEPIAIANDIKGASFILLGLVGVMMVVYILRRHQKKKVILV